ncbi:Ig-like domain-containing protein [Halobacterium salinarum]|uniref:Ig-like domain-containing protein n=1 Tax=Halobacterium salinarum TaxID=2242 RepID=UPI0025531CC4|nr:Ig-like domain-containing protein [Halobacterium salinarum]MDL0125147.1 Ig-like domain-containing protein [Halobacterium salinarum]
MTPSFATIIIAMSMYQVTIVPSENAEVEYSHSQTTQQQLMDVRNSILRSAATGTTQPASISMGVQYPTRVFLVNPPPSTGTLETAPAGEIRLENVQAAQNTETNEFFTGFFDTANTWRASTKNLTYEPDYTEYENAPTLLYASSMLSNYYPSNENSPVIPLSEQLLVNEETRTITLVALNGSVSTTQAGSVSVEPTALSAPYQDVAVEPTPGDELQLTVPIPADADTLAARTSLDSSQVSNVADGVQIQLSGEYTLRTAKVGVGSGTEGTDASYLTVVEKDRQSITLEVRDQFNNPVAGIPVNSTVISGSLEDSTLQTNEDGQVTFQTSDSASMTKATFSIKNGTHSYENVTATLSGTGTDTYNVTWQPKLVDRLNESNGVWVVNTSTGLSVDLPVRVQANGENLTNALVDYALNRSTFTGGDAQNLGITQEGLTDTNGEHTATLDIPEANGSVTVYAASGDDADSLPIKVQHTPSGDTGVPSLSSKIVDQGQTGSKARYETSYEITNTANFDYVEVEYTNLNDEFYGGETYTSNETRNNIDAYGWQDTYDGTGGNTYEITINVYNDTGAVVDSRTVTDTADGVNPGGNQDLTESDSPTLDSATLRDLDPNNVEYELEYTASDVAGKYSETEVLFVNTDNHQATDQVTGTTLSDTVSYSRYSIGDQYQVYVQVQDDDGIVVDQTIINDTANGVNPANEGGQALQAVESDGVTSGTQLQYSIRNTDDTAVTITGFAIDATPIAPNMRINNGGGDEVRITGDQQEGYANRAGGGQGSGSRFEADGTQYSLVNNGGANAILSANSGSVTVNFEDFNNNLGTLEFTDSAANAVVTVTLYLQDGREQTFHFQQH